MSINQYINAISSETKIRVRYGETDQMGVVYHGNFASFLEVGRVEWLRELGISYKEVEEKGIIMPVVSLTIYFKKPAFYDDVLTIRTTIHKKPFVKLEFDYEIYNSSHTLIVTAHTVLTFLDKDTRKPIPCPEFLLQKLSDKGLR